MDSSKQITQRDLKPFIKMLKGWNKKNGSSFRSFHLECLCMTVMEGYTITYHPSALTYFFQNSQAWISVPLPDPAGIGYNPDIESYLRFVLVISTPRPANLRKVSPQTELPITPSQ